MVPGRQALARHFTLRQLEYLVVVGETGSIARAAERLGVSSPSVSVAIAQLEADCGVPLFVRRHARGLSPTRAGRRVLARAREVLTAAEELGHLLADLSGGMAGPLRVGCLSSFAQLVLPTLRRSFEGRHPDARIRQKELDQAAILEELRSGDLDLALTYDLEIPSDIEFRAMVELPPYALLPADHPLAGRRRLTARDLVDEPMVLLDLPCSADYFLSFFSDLGKKPAIAVRTRDMAMMHAMVANGFGYGLANIRIPSDRAPDGKKLRRIALSTSLRPLWLGIARCRALPLSRTAGAFLSHCRAAFSSGLVPGLASGFRAAAALADR